MEHTVTIKNGATTCFPNTLKGHQQLLAYILVLTSSRVAFSYSFE